LTEPRLQKADYDYVSKMPELLEVYLSLAVGLVTSHDGRRRDGGERVGEGVGLHGSPAGRSPSYELMSASPSKPAEKRTFRKVAFVPKAAPWLITSVAGYRIGEDQLAGTEVGNDELEPARIISLCTVS
jgi:hypothetical protein